MAHYNTFRDQLAIAHPAFGYAMWEPDPGESLPIEVGDVGFIREGRFHRIFNALLPADHPTHEKLGVPDDYEPLRPRMKDHINRGSLSPNTLYSYGVTVVSGGVEVRAAESDDSVRHAFSFTRKLGAVMALPVTSRREDTLILGHFRKWIVGHIDSWFAFAQKLQLGLDMEDIILVSGYHRTRRWNNIIFNEVHSNTEESSARHQVTGSLGDAANNWQVSNPNQHPQGTEGTVERHGPSGENLPENQCIFVRGYRVSRTSNLLSRARKTVGPPPTANPPSASSNQHLQVAVPVPPGPSVPDSSEYRDPLHLLLDYVAERAPPDCEMVLVHDDDLTRLSGSVDSDSMEALNPDSVSRLLQRAEPQIKVMSKASNDNLSADSVPCTVAMLQPYRPD